MLIHMVFNEDSTSWLMDISLVLGHPPDRRHFGHHLDRTGAVQSSEIRGEKSSFAAGNGKIFLMLKRVVTLPDGLCVSLICFLNPKS